MENLTSEELKILYINFTHYRDAVCNGWSDISVYEYYAIYGTETWKS